MLICRQFLQRVRKTKEGRASLILLDLTTPYLSGQELLPELKSL